MKHLFIARHGDYSEGKDGIYRLNNSGRLQMEILGKDIKRILNNGSAKIISSTAPRALDSSDVLASQLALLDLNKFHIYGLVVIHQKIVIIMIQMKID